MSTPATLKSVNWAALRTLAQDRFDAYARPGDADELDAIARYAWNMATCRSLQCTLHALEITFRNQVHNALSQVKSTQKWYEIPDFLSLDEQSAVIRAKKTLNRLRRPYDPGRLVAELNFGFWTGLYGSDHENDIVRPTIRSVFSRHSSPTPLRRATVSTALRDARFLRNRVSHHEHVAFDVRLPAKYNEVVKLISWMSPQMADLASIDDDFLAVYGKTWQAYRPIVEAIFG